MSIRPLLAVRAPDTTRGASCLALLIAAIVLVAPGRVWAQAAAGGFEEALVDERVASGLPQDLSQPPDGNWLVDEEGFEYFTFELPKKGLRYARVNEETIRLSRGPYLRTAGESETHLTIKIINNKSVPMPEPKKGPTELERSMVEASYRPNVAEVDRLAFRGFGRGLPRRGLWRNGFDLADMNGDGHLDIVHGPARKTSTAPIIFLGDGNGTWRAWEDVRFDPAPYDYGDVVAGDWNADGKQDMAVGIHGRGVVILVGDGKGGFTLWNEGVELEEPGHEGRPAFSTRALTATDWDRDGRLDLMVLSEGPRGFEHVGKHGANGIMFYRNNGDGTWTKKVGGGPRVFGDKIVKADVDGDGHAEIVAATNYAGERNLVNRWVGPGPDWDNETIDSLRPLALVWAVAAGDLNGDGRDDIVASHRSSELAERRTGIDIFFAREDGGWLREPLFVRNAESGMLDFHALATGDVDGDEHPDIVATTRDGRLYLFIGDGKGGFVREVEAAMEEPLAGCRGYDLHVVDLDGKAGGEIVGSFSGESCPNGGSILAWAVIPKTEEEAASPAAAEAETSASGTR